MQLKGLKKELLLRIANEIRFEADWNINNPVPWGSFPMYEEREKGPIGKKRKDSIIANIGGLADSSQEPKIVGDNVILQYTAPYAADVEFGSEPKKVEWKKLNHWARRKFKLPEGDEANRITFFVRRKIEREGIQPHSFLRKSIHKVIQKYKK